MANSEASIVDLYEQHLSSHEPAISPPLAAVLALTSAIGSHSIQTAAEGLLLLSRLASILRQSSEHALEVAAGVDSFQNQLSTRSSQSAYASQIQNAQQSATASAQTNIQNANVEDMKKATIAAGANFVRDGIEARSRIAKFGRRFLKDGSTVVVPAPSKVVLGLLNDAKAAGVSLHIVTTSEKVMRVVDSEHNISTTLAEADGLGAALLQISRERRDTNLGVQGSILILSGADVVLADGSVLCSKPSCEAICLARGLGIDSWIACEKFKASKYMRHELTIGNGKPRAVESIVPAAYIAGLLTEDGPTNTQAFSEDTIKFWI